MTRAADWLAANPAPIHKGEVPEWSERVRSELRTEALPGLVDLLRDGDLEQQYQAAAAARVLGAEVWVEESMTWLVWLPGEKCRHQLQPKQQLHAPWEIG